MKEHIFIQNRYFSGTTDDIIFQSKELSRFLKALETKAYIPFEDTKDAMTVDYYLDGIKVYPDSIIESIIEIKKYISFLETQLYLLEPEVLDEYELQ